LYTNTCKLTNYSKMKTCFPGKKWTGSIPQLSVSCCCCCHQSLRWCPLGGGRQMPYMPQRWEIPPECHCPATHLWSSSQNLLGAVQHRSKTAVSSTYLVSFLHKSTFFFFDRLQAFVSNVQLHSQTSDILVAPTHIHAQHQRILVSECENSCLDNSLEISRDKTNKFHRQQRKVASKTNRSPVFINIG